ncbi:ATP-binding cassette sub-family G member 8 [Neocloeon triangulifer]|uniref:ATP-binding cassette sub-family G member 8 n=1 Tax=Neocloeon triangulifer TaxID=2078957 RepID=UPI00286F2C57|nr:ATP-binding cassette sub-family G member 8 [Neocloeon triangulifer]XP_059483785.1 ATP-binding cassette sub-family G member 8 [Neocloeon triangulifer]XP_059483793.1 ATP-binding cassette sub-family G member 8 [Neocloeon triangulifer]XP_059483802.1 ATP-binding cassette sub-family G member 8 [Neocloeon triangulifer]
MNERRYSVPSLNEPRLHELASEDLHAWSIYRQNLNSDFADSALGAGEKSPLPYGNFQLRESTVRSILRHPRYGPKSELTGNMYTYLKFGLPRVFPPVRRDNSSGYDSSDDGSPRAPKGGGGGGGVLRSRSETALNVMSNQPLRSASEANLLSMSELRPKRRTVHKSLPNFQLRNVHYEKGPSRVLETINLEARGGDMLGIMATSRTEGGALLDIISGRLRATKGEVWLNGRYVRPRALKKHFSVVKRECENFDASLTAKQTLRFHSWLSNAPNAKVRRAEVEALLSQLGLSQVRNTRIGALTHSERIRLQLACALLQGCDMIALDDPSRNMDIFDTFFLLEFLRQWASAGPRIVFLTIHPLTFEIFSMLSRVTLLCAGRLAFSGRRTEMLPYFEHIEYPCPAFKNPSDYYIDLVTLDDLSAEAMLESSQRIQQLTEVFANRQPPLSDPGPPLEPPSVSKPPGFFLQIWALLLRGLILRWPLCLVRFSHNLLLCAALSVAIGAIFWDLRNPAASQDSLPDWLSFYVVMMGMWNIPLSFWTALAKRPNDKNCIWQPVQALCKVLLDIPPLLCLSLAFFAPAYAMSGSVTAPPRADLFSIYIGISMLYALCSHAAMQFFLALTPKSPIMGCTLALGTNWVLLFSCGYPLHLQDLGQAWMQFVSPVRWVLDALVRPELLQVTSVTCRPVQVQRQDIIVQLPCALNSGLDVLRPLHLSDGWPWNEPLPVLSSAVAILTLVWTIFAYFALALN